MYVPFLLWKCMCMLYAPFGLLTCVYMLLCQGEPAYTSLWSSILWSWPIALWPIIWVSFHQGQHLYHTCIIMPTISPFGLDGNNHTKSLSPFDLKGKGRTKIFSPLIYILLSYSPWIHDEISDWALPLYMPRCTNPSMLPLSTCRACKNIFQKNNMTL